MTIISLLTALTWLPQLASAQNSKAEQNSRFTHEKLGFSLDIPPGFEQVPSTIPGVGLALRTIRQGEDRFPTITVTVHPYPLSSKHGRTKAAEDVAHSYRKVGLTDTQILDSQAISTPAGEGLRVQLAYSQKGGKFVSVASLLPAKDHHYVVTFIDHADSAAKSQQLLPSLIESFHSGTLPVTQTKRRYPERERYFMLFGALFAFGVLCILALYQRRNAGTKVDSPKI